MINRDEDGGLSFAGHDRRQVGAPHRVHLLGDYRAVVRARPSRSAEPLGSEQPVLAHQPQHAAAGGADPGHAQSRPDLAIALAVKAAGAEALADDHDQLAVAHRADRTGAAGGPRRAMMPVHAGATDAADPGDPRQSIRAAARGRAHPAHRLDRRRAKAPPASSRAIFSASNSRSSISSPSLAFSRSASRAFASVGFVASAASPPARNSSRQPDSVAAPRASVRPARDPRRAAAVTPPPSSAAGSSGRRARGPGPHPAPTFRRCSSSRLSSSPPSRNLPLRRGLT